MMDKIVKFIRHWWFRYLLVTELYMVEGWERFAIREYFYITFLKNKKKISNFFHRWNFPFCIPLVWTI